MLTYYLPDHVHACVADEHLVFLDTKKDLYFSLPPDAPKILRLFAIDRKIVVPPDEGPADPDGQLIAILNDLSESGAIRRTPEKSSIINTQLIPSPNREFSNGFLDGGPKINLEIALRFIRSLILAVIGTKFFNFHFLIQYLRHLSPSGRSQNKTEIDLSNEIYAFRRIRTFFYTARNHCYFDTAVMAYFLKLGGYNVHWVFAVKMGPFKAHCWLQYDDIILSDYIEHAAPFTPIMTV